MRVSIDVRSLAPGLYRYLLVGYGSLRTAEPVSSRDFRFERIFGHPPDTAAIKVEGSRSMVWVMDSLTAVPLGSSSIVHSDSPSAMSSGFFWCCQRITNRRGGSA